MRTVKRKWKVFKLYSFSYSSFDNYFCIKNDNLHELQSNGVHVDYDFHSVESF